MQDHFANAGQRHERVENLRSKGYVRLHGLPLFGIERAIFVENVFGDADFADVVKHGAEANFFHFGVGQAHGFGDQGSVGGNFL